MSQNQFYSILHSTMFNGSVQEWVMEAMEKFEKIYDEPKKKLTIPIKSHTAYEILTWESLWKNQKVPSLSVKKAPKLEPEVLKTTPFVKYPSLTEPEETSAVFWEMTNLKIAHQRNA